ncbi:TRAP transporter substrate-binding protein [Bosea sp. (in: a-proteobacteria)]|uniref:TRAP transporter substrate-binding protein n=1 Tax=Bosea sp. (in: a-proteobacteria) TaxID=1871050 RepID=UPI002618A55C|nr:TRAP transporter substrate-binding protein DctP [Bosea sp. (in: a-proteobacteria)]MCO5089807.1 TRAP transporter substrate-binding protein DctP [Bosea sp. (in: a-proteobacteria)]
MRTRLFAALAAIGLLTGAQQATAAEHEWKFFTYFGVNDLPTNMHRSFAEDLTKATGGRLKVTVYAGGELPYKFSDVLRLVATNQVQIGDLAVGLNVGELPGHNVFDLPFLCTTFDSFFKALETTGPIFATSLKDKFGIHALIQWTMPPQQIWLNQPIERIEGLKGRKIRIWSRMHSDMLKLFGATGVTITAAEVTTALERRIADGAITASIPAYDWRFFDVAKTGYMLDFQMTHQILAVNAASLEKLPDDIRKIVLDKAEEWRAKYRSVIEAGEIEARKRLVEKGETLVQPTAEDIAKARSITRPLWDSWAQETGAIGQNLLTKASAACVR